MNIYDIAERAGVSVSTVSRVLNDNPNVSAKSREKVLRVMKEVDYTPNIFARGLNLNSIKTVGILCPVIDDLNHARTVAILERLLRDKGFGTLLISTGSNVEDKGKHLELLLHRRVDAVVVIGSTGGEAEDPAAFAPTAARIPVVILNGLVRHPNVYCVLCDEEAAVADIVAQLCARGHKRIVYLTDSPTYSAAQKLAGYRRGLAACGLEADERLLLRIPDDGREGEGALHAMEGLIASGVPFSAVVGCDDMVAIGALKALSAHGLALPVVGFNNSDYTFCSTPSLSSIDNRMDQICAAAVDIMMDVIDGREAVSRIMVSARFVERDSFRL